VHKSYLYFALIITCATPSVSQAAAERESLLHRQARKLREVVAAAKLKRRAELLDTAVYTKTNNGLIKISLTDIVDPSSGKVYSYDQYTQFVGKDTKKDIIFVQTAYGHDGQPVYSRFTYQKAKNALLGSFVVDPYTEWIKTEDEYGDVDFEGLPLEEFREQEDVSLEFLDLSANPFIRVK
jgi:predicted membrane-bound spermidine synthase